MTVDMRKLMMIVESDGISRKGSLVFHGTSIPALLDIISDGLLRGDLGVDDYGHGVSFTTSLGVAWKFAAQAEDYFWSDNQPPPGFGAAEHDATQPQGAVLAFNHATLAQMETLRRVQWDGVATERELRSSGDVGLTNGLAMIRVRKQDLVTYQRVMEQERDAFTETQIAALPSLLSHPLLRVR